MVSLKQIISEARVMQDLQALVQAYQQISAARMKRIRNTVLAKRAFLAEIASVFEDVKASYEKEIIALMRGKKMLKGEEIAKLTLLVRNGKTAYVLLTANTGLYGDILDKTFQLFWEHFQKRDGDAIIIGRFGRALFEQKMPHVEYTYFDFPDTSLELENFPWVVEHLLRYQKVFVFHGQFKNIVIQEGAITGVSGDELSLPESASQPTFEPNLQYLFEPSLEDVMAFFENEIAALILEQAVFEGQLAKFAARMWLMEKASDNINKGIQRLVFAQKLAKHKQDNKKQQETLSGRRLWVR